LRTSNQAAGQQDPGTGTQTAGDGLIVNNLMAIVVSVWPGAPGGGATLSGAGSLLCWLFNPYIQQWSRCPDLDLTMSTTTGLPAQTFSAIINPSRLGFLINYATSGVTSSAPDVLVRIDGFQSSIGP
jgi:hypothetical protein